MPRLSAMAVAAILTAALLTSCSSMEGAGSENPSSPQTSISPTASAPPSPDESAGAEPVITPEGLGSLRIGEPYRESPIVQYDPDRCEGIEGETGRWTSAPDPEDFVPLPAVTSMPDILTNLVIYSPEFETETGIHVGSTLADLQAAHPELTEPAVDTGRSSAYLLDSADGRIIFEVLGIDSAGPLDTVSAITISSENDESLMGVYYGVDGPGGCA